ncbi:uncharacterized protein EAF01_010861 [Botrytis porri]|nr:uncharacterized protein EAF01_010861 [Botrytis porri]KAF7889368.1 hypothetical protein EAF01_010861 [Botrytis porri]
MCMDRAYLSYRTCDVFDIPMPDRRKWKTVGSDIKRSIGDKDCSIASFGRYVSMRDGEPPLSAYMKHMTMLTWSNVSGKVRVHPMKFDDVVAVEPAMGTEVEMTPVTFKSPELQLAMDGNIKDCRYDPYYIV